MALLPAGNPQHRAGAAELPLLARPAQSVQGTLQHEPQVEKHKIVIPLDTEAAADLTIASAFDADVFSE